jgi:hypothetical protein
MFPITIPPYLGRSPQRDARQRWNRRHNIQCHHEVGERDLQLISWDEASEVGETPNDRALLSHPILEGKSNANHVRARIRTHVYSDYIIGHHHTMLELNNEKVLSHIKMSETSTESNTYP